MKKCTRCKELKQLDCFSGDVSKKDKRISVCKICTRKRSLELRIKNGYIPRVKQTKEQKNKKQLQHRNNKLKTDPIFKFKCNTRSLLYNSFKRACNGRYVKSEKSENLLGCDMDFFIEYIKTKFQKEMSMDNYGKWHLDHIKPLSKCNTESDIIAYNHYTNFQPLWAIDNIRKGGK